MIAEKIGGFVSEDTLWLNEFCALPTNRVVLTVVLLNSYKNSQKYRNTMQNRLFCKISINHQQVTVTPAILRGCPACSTTVECPLFSVFLSHDILAALSMHLEVIELIMSFVRGNGLHLSSRSQGPIFNSIDLLDNVAVSQQSQITMRMPCFRSHIAVLYSLRVQLRATAL